MSFIHLIYGFYESVPLYWAASLVGFRRTEEETSQHDIYDIWGGASVGILSSHIFTRPRPGTRVRPVLEKGYYKLTIRTEW